MTRHKFTISVYLYSELWDVVLKAYSNFPRKCKAFLNKNVLELSPDGALTGIYN